MNDHENSTGLSQESLINLFLHTATKEDLASNKLDVDRRFGEVDKTLSEFKSDVDRRFNDVDRRFNDVDRRFNDVDRRFNDVDKRFERSERLLYWLIGLGITSIVLPIAMPTIKSMF